MLGDHRDSSAAYGAPCFECKQGALPNDLTEHLTHSRAAVPVSFVERCLDVKSTASNAHGAADSGLYGSLAGVHKVSSQASCSDAMASGRLLSCPSPVPTRSKSPLTPAALDLNDASVSSTLSIIGSGAVAKSASVRAPWAKLHGRIAVIRLQASTVSLRTAQSAPHCKDRANHNGQAAGLHTCQEQLAAVFHQTKCRGTPTKPAGRPARNRGR